MASSARFILRVLGNSTEETIAADPRSFVLDDGDGGAGGGSGFGGEWPSVDREYGVGRGRIDLVVRWHYTGTDGRRTFQREAMELKVWRPGKPDPLPEGLRQLDDYLGRLDLDHGVLVIFDRGPDAEASADRTLFGTEQTPSGRAVTLLRA